MRHMKREPFKNILVDMDNTLVDWTNGINNELNSIYRGLTIRKLDKLPKWIGKLILRYVYYKNPSFWDNLSPIHHNVVLIKQTIDDSKTLTDPPKVYICTTLSGIGNRINEEMGKRVSATLIESRYGILFDGIIFVPSTDEKTTHFPPGRCLLIDDYRHNIDKAEECGHEAILI